MKASGKLNQTRYSWQSDCGATVVEYALMLGLIVLFAVVGIGSLGQRTNRSFDATQSQIQVAP